MLSFIFLDEVVCQQLLDEMQVSDTDDDDDDDDTLGKLHYP